ncbi:Pyridine nucleotide-disulfide oxidoreductase-like protein 17 [Elsinoe fawcettii]|nr:Pyridine nucleotide-disulfide oxidoreductase-like protein 17 [Elsinoe fawcettii]
MNGTVRSFPIKGTDLKGSLPEASFDKDIDANTVAAACVERLKNLSVTDLLPDSLWKDNICMTGTFRTFHSSTTIIEAWSELVQRRKPKDFKPIPHAAHVIELAGRPAWVAAGFLFKLEASPASYCSGFFNAAPDASGEWKIFSLTTILEALDGHANPDTPPPVPPLKAPNGVLDCLVVGGGLCGLGLGARLQSVGLTYLVVDKHEVVGDVWRHRYDSTRLHISGNFSELPYGRLLDPAKYYATGKELADAHKAFAKQWQLNVRTSTTVHSASWDITTKTWSVKINHAGMTDMINTKHLVMATGNGINKPYIPQLADREKFKGTILHMSDYKNAHSFQGKRGVVVGSANSAFDVMEDMVQAGLSSVTMIQRGRTRIVNGKHFKQLIDPLYSANSNIELSDRLMMATPYQHGRLMTMANISAMQAKDQGWYDKLGKAGFNYHDDTDVMADYMERAGGHYLDVGQTKYIEDGTVKVKSGSEVAAFTEDGLVLKNGDTVEADVVVFATGFSVGMKSTAADIVGTKIADQLDEFWGLDRNGDTNGLAKPIGHSNIWYLGGGTGQGRFISRFLALQILADVAGTPFTPYTAGLKD